MRPVVGCRSEKNRKIRILAQAQVIKQLSTKDVGRHGFAQSPGAEQHAAAGIDGLAQEGVQGSLDITAGSIDFRSKVRVGFLSWANSVEEMFLLTDPGM